MTRIDHERARELMLDARIGENAGEDRRWLDAHLSDCAECARFSAALDQAVSAIRLPAVMADAALVRTTQLRVRSRAFQLQSQAAAMRPLWVAVALVCAMAALTTPLLWSAFAWLGAWFGLSTLEWRTGFFLTWLAPTLAASFIFIAGDMTRATFRAVVTRNAEAL